MIEIIRSVSEMRAWSGRRKNDGLSIGFVPTMGALHDGHLNLARVAESDNDTIVASIFVNPTQFGPDEDFDTYPRTFETDVEALEKIGVRSIFAPTVDEMYPTGGDRFSWVTVDELATHWCGASRPGFFRGVATVVTKLFNAVQPTRAYFGEKDFQQFTIIKRMVKELLFPVEIIAVPTTREEDGLAMSSRNAYLGAEARKNAPQIAEAMRSTSERFERGETDVKALVAHLRECLENIEGGELDYAGIADLETLKPIVSGQLEAGCSARILCAVHLEGARLIDNMPLCNV